MEKQVAIPALNGYASEYNPIRWEYFVDHYENATQADRDSKMTYLTKEGEYYVGLYPPEGAEKLGIYYPREHYPEAIIDTTSHLTTNRYRCPGRVY